MSRAYFSKPIQLRRKIDEFFASEPEIKTIEALVLFLGLSWNAFYEYSEKKGYDRIIEEAYKKIADGYIQGALSGKYNPTFTQFLLKNKYGYKDKIETENSNTHKIIIERVNENGSDEN